MGQKIMRRISCAVCMILLGILTISARPPVFAEESGYPMEAASDQNRGEASVRKEGESPSNQEETEKTENRNGIVYQSDLLETQAHDAYISGYPDGSFRPDAEMNRAEVASMFFGLLKTPPEEYIGRYRDVPTDAWFARSVNTLSDLGIISAQNWDMLYDPLGTMRRGEFVQMVANFVEAKAGETTDFPDVPLGHPAYEAVKTLRSYGWISGYADGGFHPEDPITRGDAVTMVNGLLGRKLDPGLGAYGITARFSDVEESHPLFGAIGEAATDHSYGWASGSEERWDLEENQIYTWEGTEEGWKFKNLNRNSFVTGFRPIGGQVYYFDPDTQLLKSGWQEIDGLHYLLPDKDEPADSPEISENLTEVNYLYAGRDWKEIDYITIHYTGNPGPTAQGWTEHFQEIYRGTSAHYFVDPYSIWRSVADSDVAWHVGTNGTYYHETARNENSIGIEMSCEKFDSENIGNPMDPDWYFVPQTEYNTAALVRSLMKAYGVPIEHLIRHYDVSHKVCPSPYMLSFYQWQHLISLVTKNEIDYMGQYEATVLTDDVPVFRDPDANGDRVDTKFTGNEVTVYEERTVGTNAGDIWGRIGENQWISMPNLMRK